jgi:DNA end-binding protein Ku
MTDKDFEKVPLKTTRSIDLQAFVGAEEIDPIFFFDTHYLEPRPMGEKPFQLLREAMIKTGKVAVAKVTFARKEHLACLRPFGEGLSLHSMRYPAEIMPPPEVMPLKTELTKAELTMAESLINSMVQPFDPGQYRDEYREALQKIIDAKVKGRKPAPTQPPPAEEDTVDLMAALEASLAKAKTGVAGKG